jgi:hypothetical protein
MAWTACRVDRGLSRSCGILSPAVVGRAVAAVGARGGTSAATVSVEQFVNEAGGFELAELLYALAEALAYEVIDLVLVEVVLVHEFHDEILLLVGALPATVVLDVSDGSGCWSIGSQKPESTENDSAMIAIHLKIRNRNVGGMEWLMNGWG